jgi:hypothetical protein
LGHECPPPLFDINAIKSVYASFSVIARLVFRDFRKRAAGTIEYMT